MRSVPPISPTTIYRESHPADLDWPCAIPSTVARLWRLRAAASGSGVRYRNVLAKERELVGDDRGEEWFDVGIEVATGVDTNGRVGHACCGRLCDMVRGDSVYVGDLDKGGAPDPGGSSLRGSWSGFQLIGGIRPSEIMSHKCFWA